MLSFNPIPTILTIKQSISSIINSCKNTTAGTVLPTRASTPIIFQTVTTMADLSAALASMALLAASHSFSTNDVAMSYTILSLSYKNGFLITDDGFKGFLHLCHGVMSA
jgi:hypothetical protein